MARYNVVYSFTRNGKTDTATMEARSVREVSDIAFMVLTAQYGDTNIARADANSIEKQFKEWRNKRAVICLSGVFTLSAHVCE